MNFTDMVSQLRRKKKERAMERQRRDKARTDKARAVLSSLNVCIQAFNIPQVRATADNNDVYTLIVENGHQAVKLIVVEADKFTIRPHVGGSDCKTVTEANENEMMRALLPWLVPDLRDD
jgi:hypothetical protein